jgi:hypothetical protein
MSDLSPLSGVERKLDFGAVRSVFDPQRTSGLRSKGGWHSARVVPYLVITASEKGSDALRLFQMMLISLNTHLKVVFLSQAKLFLRQSPRRLTCPHTA